MEETDYVGVRVPRNIYNLLQKRRKTSEGVISLSAVVRHILTEAVKGKKVSKKK